MAKVEYWLQIENHPWDVMPQGIDRMTGNIMKRDANGFHRPLPSAALLIRRYSNNWQNPDDRPVNAWDLNEPDPAQTQGTLPGATIEARLGDELIIHFRNMDMREGVSEAERTHSLHLHGAQRTPLYDGTFPFSPPDPSQGDKQGDRVTPGDSFDYHVTCYHAANVGTWPYHDHSINHHDSISRGAFGAVIIRAATESLAEQPQGKLRTPGDSPTQFAAVPKPPASGEHIIFFHQLVGVGECINGRQMLGNTPTLLARPDSRLRFRVLNLTDRGQSFHIHGHRWQQGTGWTDVQTLGPAMTLTVEMLEQSVENGGGLGEWLMMSHSEQMGHTMSEMRHPGHALSGSLIVTEGGALTLRSAVKMSVPEKDQGGHHH